MDWETRSASIPRFALIRLGLADLRQEPYPDARDTAIEHLDCAIAELSAGRIQPALQRAEAPGAAEGVSEPPTMGSSGPGAGAQDGVGVIQFRHFSARESSELNAGFASAREAHLIGSSKLCFGGPLASKVGRALLFIGPGLD